MVKEAVATMCLKERNAVICIFYKRNSPTDLKEVRKKTSGQDQRQAVEAEWR